MNKPLSILLFISLAFATFSNCKVKQGAAEEGTSLDTSQIMVLLKMNATAKLLEQKFKAYDLKAKGQTSRSENKWIFTYNMEIIKPKEMLKKIKASDLVLEAEFLSVKKDF